MRTVVLGLTLTVAVALFTSQGDAFKKNDRVARDFRHADKDRDGKLSRSEWNRRGNFEYLDRNADKSLSLQEVHTLYKGHDNRGYDWPPKGMSKPVVKIDLSINADRVGREALDYQTLCGISRSRICEVVHQRESGLIETGTGPRFPGNAHCASIDDYWAMDYSHKRKRRAYHGGIDIPVQWGTPMLAIAARSVVAKYQAHH